MQDVRLRTGAAILLSAAAFLSLAAAIAAAAWCLLVAHRLSLRQQGRLFFSLGLIVGFFAIVLQLTGGDGASYFIRMMVIVLIGAWVYSEQEKGEFLRLWVWLLGERAGFELGLIADMGMQAMDLLVADFQKIRLAGTLKRQPLTAGRMAPAGIVLVTNALRRADETSELLAVRGYTGGGTLCPVFTATTGDILAFLGAACIFGIAIVR